MTTVTTSLQVTLPQLKNKFKFHTHAPPPHSHAWGGGFRGGLLPGVETSLGFLVAEGLGGISGAWAAPPGGSGARRTGWRGEKVPWETPGREADPVWERERERELINATVSIHRK